MIRIVLIDWFDDYDDADDDADVDVDVVGFGYDDVALMLPLAAVWKRAVKPATMKMKTIIITMLYW